MNADQEQADALEQLRLHGGVIIISPRGSIGAVARILGTGITIEQVITHLAMARLGLRELCRNLTPEGHDSPTDAEAAVDDIMRLLEQHPAYETGGRCMGRLRAPGDGEAKA